MLIRYLFVFLFVIVNPHYLCADTHVSADCELATVQAVIDLETVVTGDIVTIPGGNCTWGTDGAYLSVNKEITLQGAGVGVTIIDLATTAGSWGEGTIRISAAATVKGFSIRTAESGNSGTAFSTGTVNGWRITGINYNDRTSTPNGYFVYVGSVYGLIDNNTLSENAGTMELIFVRGLTDSWQTAHSIGGESNLFIENNTFNGRSDVQGYVCDCNSNSRCVVRYNTITGPMKIDGHGLASNSPARGVRHMEIYNNTFLCNAGNWRAIEIRGGTGRIFNNTSTSSYDTIYLSLNDYCYIDGANYGNCDNECKCADDRPVTDQIGIGVDPKSAASEPLYIWNNIRNGGQWTPGHSVLTESCISACGNWSQADAIISGTDYFVSETKPEAMSAYTPYTCPHPLTGLTGSCNSSIAGTSGYNVNLSPTTSTSTASGSFNLR